MHRIASLDFDEEADIDWRSLSDPSWDTWSVKVLKNKWKGLKASCNADGGVKCHRGEYMAFICQFFLPYILDRRRTAPRGTDETDPHSGQFCVIHDPPLSST